MNNSTLYNIIHIEFPFNLPITCPYQDKTDTCKYRCYWGSIPTPHCKIVRNIIKRVNRGILSNKKCLVHSQPIYDTGKKWRIAINIGIRNEDAPLDKIKAIMVIMAIEIPLIKEVSYDKTIITEDKNLLPEEVNKENAYAMMMETIKR